MSKMRQEHKDQLAEICRWYGVYAVVQELDAQAQNLCETDYKNSPESVIHRDSASLFQTVQMMKANHFLRGA